MLINSKSRRSGKQIAYIKSLPDNPDHKIIWIVYNQDMVEYTVNLIKEIKGEEYMHNVVVTARNDENTSKYAGTVYFDPLLYDHLYNGLM